MGEGAGYVLAFFVGGPWDRRPERIPAYCREWRVPAPVDPFPPWPVDGMVPDVTIPLVSYFPDRPLSTGVPVMSCLWGGPRW